MKTCPECGVEVLDGDLFCPEGHDLSVTTRFYCKFHATLTSAFSKIPGTVSVQTEQIVFTPDPPAKGKPRPAIAYPARMIEKALVPWSLSNDLHLVIRNRKGSVSFLLGDKRDIPEADRKRILTAIKQMRDDTPKIDILGKQTPPVGP